MMKYRKDWADFIQDGVVNRAIANHHDNPPERIQDCATPSTLLDCPRAVWMRYKHNIAAPIPLTWGKAQRMLHGRVFENVIAQQLRESGNLLYHWKDDIEGESVKFEMGEGLTHMCGTPDLLLKLLDGRIAISDAKTSMAKSFGYIPVNPKEVFEDFYWYKYKLQVTGYFMLAHKNKDWFAAMPAGVYDEGKWHGELPLPEACHLFSYALDDGVNRREFTWASNHDDFSQVLYYVQRWNKAYISEEMPDCTCDEFDGAPKKFCYYVTKQETTRTGSKIGIECCNEDLYKLKEQI